MKRLHVVAIALISYVTLSANSCEDKLVVAGCLNMDRVPKVYRDCVEKVTPLPKGQISLKQGIQLLATVRASELRLSKCGRDGFNWADHQVAICTKKVKR